MKCRKLWPAGTIWCGTCHGTLGKRHCPDGHASPLFATCCTTCGSTRLSPGLPCVNLRPVTWLTLLAICAVLAPTVLGMIGSAVRGSGTSAGQALLPILYAAALMSAAIAILGGQRGSRLVTDFWMGVGRFLVRLATAISRALLGGNRRGKP
jgi:hypothetical protein